MTRAEPATEQPTANPSLFEDPQVTEAAMAEATRDRRLGACRLQKRSGGGIQARTTATGQFSCADMKLSAAQVFGREDEDGGGAY